MLYQSRFAYDCG